MVDSMDVYSGKRIILTQLLDWASDLGMTVWGFLIKICINITKIEISNYCCYCFLITYAPQPVSDEGLFSLEDHVQTELYHI